MTVCEFPFAAKVAEDAVANDEHLILGGPNVVRGGSHTSAMSAEDAISNGLCTVLASDYYYPSLLHAVESLVRRGVQTLPEAWQLISQNPAVAMGLSDRGSLEAGKRAYLVVVDCRDNRRVVHTIAGG